VTAYHHKHGTRERQQCGDDGDARVGDHTREQVDSRHGEGSSNNGHDARGQEIGIEEPKQGSDDHREERAVVDVVTDHRDVRPTGHLQSSNDFKALVFEPGHQMEIGQTDCQRQEKQRGEEQDSPMARQHPQILSAGHAGAADAAVTIRVLVQVLLVILLRQVVRRRICDLRGNRAKPVLPQPVSVRLF